VFLAGDKPSNVFGGQSSSARTQNGFQDAEAVLVIANPAFYLLRLFACQSGDTHEDQQLQTTERITRYTFSPLRANALHPLR